MQCRGKDQLILSQGRSRPARTTENGKEGKVDSQSSELGLQVLPQEDPLLGPSPLDVILGALDLSSLSVGDGGEVVDEGSD